VYSIEETLDELLNDLDPILNQFKKYLSSKNIEILNEISSQLFFLARQKEEKLKKIEQDILVRILIDASISINNYILNYRRTLSEVYIEDIYILLNKIAEEIRRGTYASSLRRMINKQKTE